LKEIPDTLFGRTVQRLVRNGVLNSETFTKKLRATKRKEVITKKRTVALSRHEEAERRRLQEAGIDFHLPEEEKKEEQPSPINEEIGERH
jgi:hypothetical protein